MIVQIALLLLGIEALRYLYIFSGFCWFRNIKTFTLSKLPYGSRGEECDVVVVGGGMAGLAAARTLLTGDRSLR